MREGISQTCMKNAVLVGLIILSEVVLGISAVPITIFGRDIFLVRLISMVISIL